MLIERLMYKNKLFAVLGQRICSVTRWQSGELLRPFMDYLHWSTCCHMSHPSQKPCNSRSYLPLIVHGVCTCFSTVFCNTVFQVCV